MYTVIAFLILAYICSVAHSFGFYPTDQEFQYTSNERVRPDITVKPCEIEQPLDHFNTSINKRWKMRCYKSMDFWEPDGPVYLVISGQNKASPSYLTGGMVYELAKETHGALYLSEHRFYGDSMPFKQFNIRNLKYLNARQALADIAELLKFVKKKKEFKNSKVVVLGGSYAGNLAAWLKLLYPDLIDAAIASSAPVLAKIDFHEYIETVSDGYKKYGIEGCWNDIKTKFDEYEKYLKTPRGIAYLKWKKNICQYSDLNRLEHQQIFTMLMINPFMTIAQEGNTHNFTLHCQNIMNSMDSALSDNSIANYDENLLYWDDKRSCINIDIDRTASEIRRGKGGWYSHWFYQQCNEFGYAKTTSSAEHPFTRNINKKLFFKFCSMVYGPEFNEKTITEAVEHTNKVYQGLKPQLKNVIFVNGELDPWHRLGILKSLHKYAPAILIPKSSHCKDLDRQRKMDPPELIKARIDIKKLIKEWIQFDEKQ